MKIAPYQIDSYIEGISKNQNLWGVVIYGPESGLISIRSNKIAKSIVENLADPFLVTNISSKKISEDPALLADEFCSIPMLGGRKLIMVSNVGNTITPQLKMIFDNDKKPLGENFILITAEELDKNSSLRKFAEASLYLACLACYEDDAKTAAQIISAKFKELKLTAEDGVTNLIINKFGKNRLIILNELEKLALFLGDEKHVTMEIAQKTVADISEISMSEFTNNFVDLDPKNSNYFLNKLYDEKTSAIALIRVLSGYFMKLQIVKNKIQNGANLDAEVKAQYLFFKQEILFKKHLQRWSLNMLDDILQKLQELEISCKSAGSNSELLLASFVNLACVKYSKAA